MDANYQSNDIQDAINKCLYDDSFRQICFGCENPYGEGDAGIKIAEILSTVNLDGKEILRKEMLNKGLERDGWYN